MFVPTRLASVSRVSFGPTMIGVQPSGGAQGVGENEKTGPGVSVGIGKTGDGTNNVSVGGGVIWATVSGAKIELSDSIEARPIPPRTVKVVTAAKTSPPIISRKKRIEKTA